MTKIAFTKMNGAGNDFVIIDQRHNNFTLANADFSKICDRKNGIGCDQLVFIKKSSQADCLMEIYNQDGSISAACGNATRCVASILFKENSQKTNITIATAADILHCQQQQDGKIFVKMTPPKFNWQEIPLAKEQNSQGFELLGYKFYCANIGNPHAVTFLEQEIRDHNVLNIGPKIENNALFPQKTNVEFVNIKSNQHIIARVWERGAGETKACGTGACAIGAVAIKNKLINTNNVTISFPGGDITIEWSGNDNEPIIMGGDYDLEFSGEYET